jgi:hypothetical protein
MSVDERGDLRITGWRLNVQWTDGREENIIDIPDDIASMIDEWLSELEEEVK